MEIEIMEFKKKPLGNKMGKVIVKYHDIFLKCNLMIYRKESKLWIKMPEVWVTKEKKKRFCYWRDKEISADFQKTVLNKLFDKYDLDYDKLEQIFLNMRQASRQKKKQQKEIKNPS